MTCAAIWLLWLIFFVYLRMFWWLVFFLLCQLQISIFSHKNTNVYAILYYLLQPFLFFKFRVASNSIFWLYKLYWEAFSIFKWPKNDFNWGGISPVLLIDQLFPIVGSIIAKCIRHHSNLKVKKLRHCKIVNCSNSNYFSNTPIFAYHCTDLTIEFIRSIDFTRLIEMFV